MKASEFFQSHEIVPPEIHNSEALLDSWYISDWQIRVADHFRKRYGPTIINDYAWGGEVYAPGITYDMSGTRPPRMDVIGARYSMHKCLLALDLKFKNATPDEVREDILNNKEEFLKLGVTTIESGEIADTWVHIDGRSWPGERDTIKVVRP